MHYYLLPLAYVESHQHHGRRRGQWQWEYRDEEDDAAEVRFLTLYKGRDIMDYSNVLTVIVLAAIATL